MRTKGGVNMRCKRLNLVGFIAMMLKDFRGEAGGGEGGEGGQGGGQGGGEPDIQWPEGLDDSLKGNPTLMKHVDKATGAFNTVNAMRSLVHATSMIGADKIAAPRDSWSDDQWSEFYGKAGRPESPDKYEVENKVPEGLQVDDSFFNSLKTTAHQLGLNSKQVQGMLDFNYNMADAGLKRQADIAKQNEAELEATLKTDWGADFDKNSHLAEQGLKNFTDDEHEFKKFKDSGYLKDPMFAKLMLKVSEGLKEDSFRQEATSTFGLSSAEIDAKMGEIYSQITDPKNFANKKALQAEYSKLSSQKAALKRKSNSSMFS